MTAPTTTMPDSPRPTTPTPDAPGHVAWGIEPIDAFPPRHIGPDDPEIASMLAAVGVNSLDDLINETIPAAIRMEGDLDLGAATAGLGEHEALRELRTVAQKNVVNRSFIGMGYHGTITPPVILRNILENPGWYTQYTPYQAEIAQGRLEALLNFQTMVTDLTGMEVAGASLLDEATAAAEAMIMCDAITGGRTKGRGTFLVADDCHPQTIAVMQARAESNGIDLTIKPVAEFDFSADNIAGCLVQYPTTDGRIVDYTDLVERAHEHGTLVVAAADILALTLLTPPGEWGSGADIAIGSTQRFGVPMGFGGPHAAYMATREKFVRKMPGRIIGVSKDAMGNRCYRMAIQTREQHIKRERATSNICTAQVLLAIMASMYAVYHGPKGLRKIAERVWTLTHTLRSVLRAFGHDVDGSGELLEKRFDTLRVYVGRTLTATQIVERAADRGMNLRTYEDGAIGISLDETSSMNDVLAILDAFDIEIDATDALWKGEGVFPKSSVDRTSDYLQHPVFNTHHSETEMLRYMATLQSRDLSLAHSMIPLGSCTMKLNATSEMLPVTWHEFANMHPFAPANQTKGYAELFERLEHQLAEITGLPAVSLQPNAGSQGEYAGLLVIRAYHHARGDTQRNICLIPVSAHGTNPASAVAAGFKVVTVACDKHGNINLDDLTAKAGQHKDNLAALMVTYPSTHGVFEPNIKDVCAAIHQHGGQVYLDGANMNAQVGLCRPGDYGADVCHLNLHKTFCIPHGGGGPGMGPICAKDHLAPYLPSHPVVEPATAGKDSVGAISAAPYGSPAILPISYMYIAMMGAAGLKRASEVAILNANYMAARLRDHYDILFTGKTGRVAHEFIIDCRGFKKSADIEIDDIAKRLMDYGFHAPTMSWPVPGTLMIEPTESEALSELDRFCDAMIAIREEIRAIEDGKADREDNPLQNAPHPAIMVTANDWDHPYTREQAAYPLPWLRDHKFWPPVARVDNPYGDRNLHCTCPPLEEYN